MPTCLARCCKRPFGKSREAHMALDWLRWLIVSGVFNQNIKRIIVADRRDRKSPVFPLSGHNHFFFSFSNFKMPSVAIARYNLLNIHFLLLQICKGKEVTYFEMLRMLQRYAAGFQSHGVKPGDKVLVHVEDSVESLVAMYGIVCAGGVVIPSEPGSEQGM